jgi:ubiquinone/menaquinone biosynthesis C-methylase UbiE
MAATVDTTELEAKVQRMYRAVANEPHGTYHFELGRSLAERLGYPGDILDRLPAGAIESFAGVGYFFDLAGLRAGERVLDLGSGSGMDALFAATQVRSTGAVVGVDFTDDQLTKARSLALEGGFEHVEYREGRIERVPADDESADCVISNGVINLSPDKEQVFREAARALRPGGRIAIADIVSERPLPEGVTCNATLWAACIGGALQQDRYVEAIEAAGLKLQTARDNSAYRFLTEQARKACATYGVKSVSYLAVKR